MIFTDPVSAAPAFAEAIAGAQRILLMTHVNPDGDAIGSLLGVAHMLRAIGKTPIPLASSALPNYSAGLPAIETVTVYTPGSKLPDADLIWLVDTASLARVGQIHTDHEAELLARPLIIVDHHVTNSGEGRLNLIDSQSASCCDLLVRLFQAMHVPITPEAATCLILGLTTDTQSFQTSATNAGVLRAAADLLDLGADHRAVINAIYFSYPVGMVRLSGMVTSQIQQDGGLVWSSLTREMVAAATGGDEAGDDAVSRMQRVAGMRIAALFKERNDGTVKLSLRSIPGIDVSAICRIWGGGGHAQAAGATLPMGLAEAEPTVLAILRSTLGME